MSFPFLAFVGEIPGKSKAVNWIQELVPWTQLSFFLLLTYRGIYYWDISVV